MYCFLMYLQLRHLILFLEREAIDLVHLWPKAFPSLEPGREKACCYWFFGLVIKSGETGLNLTIPIKMFSELVMRSATQIKVRKSVLLGSPVNIAHESNRVVLGFETNHFQPFFLKEMKKNVFR